MSKNELCFATQDILKPLDEETVSNDVIYVYNKLKQYSYIPILFIEIGRYMQMYRFNLLLDTYLTRIANLLERKYFIY